MSAITRISSGVKNRMVFKKSNLCSALSLLLAAGVASAQQLSTDNAAEEASQSSQRQGLEEVVVTARRREESLQDVPVAVSALNGAALKEQRITSEGDLQVAVPGLTVKGTGSSNQLNFSLRGQSVDAYSFSQPAVVTYVNEFQSFGVTASTFFDMDSIQVLKGPQGTLFGRNATGGAVLLATKKPGDEMEGYLTVGGGNYGRQEIEGAVTVPLTDWAGIRIAGSKQETDGYQKNLFNGKDLAAIDNETVRVTLTIAPTDALENTLMYQHGEYGGTSAAGKLYSYYDNSLLGTLAYDFGGTVLKDIPGTTAASFSPLFSNISEFAAYQDSLDFYDLYNDTLNTHDAENDLVVNTTVYNISDTLQLKNIMGYSETLSRDKTDVDGSPFHTLTIGLTGGPTSEGYTYLNRQYSNELQLSGEAMDGKLNYIVGGFYSYGKDKQRLILSLLWDIDKTNTDFTPLGPDLAGIYAGFAGAQLLREYETEDYSKAVFAQASYAVTDNFQLTAGVRNTWERIEFYTQQFDPVLGGDVNFLAFGLEKSVQEEDKPSWNLTADYRINDDLMIYFAHRGSWRVGSFNGTADPSIVNGEIRANELAPETTYDFEIGAKFSGYVAGMPAAFNVSVYDQYVEDVQRAVYIGISAVSGNVGEAQITGIELDGQISPVEWLEFGASVTYTDARYTDPEGTVNNTTLTFGPYADTPEMSGSAWFKASTLLDGDKGELVFRGDAYAQSHWYYSNLHDSVIPETRFDGYHLINARLSWNEVLGSSLSASAWVKNITDEEYETGGFALGAVIGMNTYLPGEPRMFGVEFNYEF